MVDNQIDLFGDAYEFLISNYAASAGKSGGEFFTPSTCPELIARLAVPNQTCVSKIYDPVPGSWIACCCKKKRTLINASKMASGQELNHTTYNLARMNMFLHNVNWLIQHPVGQRAGRSAVC